jgi:hypothetical protein
MTDGAHQRRIQLWMGVSPADLALAGKVTSELSPVPLQGNDVIISAVLEFLRTGTGMSQILQQSN